VSEAALAKTPLFDRHVSLGANIGPFSGYSMPIVYSRIGTEHEAVRTAAGIFDVSHMGRLHFRGSGAVETLERLTTIHVPSIEHGCARYGVVLDAEAGVIDDVFLYSSGTEPGVGVPDGAEYMLVVNAGNLANVLKQLASLEPVCVPDDETDTTGMIAVQGPSARGIVSVVLGVEPPVFSNRVERIAWKDIPLLVATTGYTGEDGAEIIGPNEAVADLWDCFIEAGVTPAGLGARDTLRLEVAYPLHGHELSTKITPNQARISWAVDLGNTDFHGRDAYMAARQANDGAVLVGLRCEGRGVPRAEQIIYHEGKVVGTVTSGTHSPTLKTGIALGYVTTHLAVPGTKVELAAAGSSRQVDAQIVKTPFYTYGSRRPSEPNRFNRST
jgi:aminomethyltransferase